MKADAFFNQFFPLGGNVATQNMVTLPLSTTPTSVDLRAYFGSIDNGDGFLLKADGLGQPSGWTAYFSLTEKAVTISQTQSTPGTASGAQCWPLQDGQEMFGKLTSGRVVATGFATALAFPILNIKASAGSGMFKLMRRTLVEPQDASRFQAPIPSYPTAVAQGLMGPSGAWNPRP